MQRRCLGVWRIPDYWPHAHRYTGSMTSTQALKENMGDPERENLLSGSGTERFFFKKKAEDSQQEG